MTQLSLTLGNVLATVHPTAMRIRTRLALWRSRRDLAQLDRRALDDIGVTFDEAQREASLTVWDVPSNWKVK